MSMDISGWGEVQSTFMLFRPSGGIKIITYLCTISEFKTNLLNN